MTNLQHLLSIGIPTFIFLLTWSTNNKTLAEIKQTLVKHDGKFDQIKDSQHKGALEIMS